MDARVWGLAEQVSGGRGHIKQQRCSSVRRPNSSNMIGSPVGRDANPVRRTGIGRLARRFGKQLENVDPARGYWFSSVFNIWAGFGIPGVHSVYSSARMVP